MIDPTQAGQPAQPAPQGGATVCISPQGDGSFAVYVEGSEPTGPAPDIEAALEQARQLLAGGQAAPSDAEAKAEELFTGGFAEARGG